jgi:rare lipoprotein A
MKSLSWTVAALLLLVSGCSPTIQRQPMRHNQNFFTPRNWQIPITKTEETASPIEADSSADLSKATEELDEQMIGYASWYGPGFHGEKTANGEDYNQDELTAAHKLLPMNTWIQVTNTENNKIVTVRINDRGPYKKNRIVDLTRKAAEILEFKDQGTARVVLKVVKYPDDYNHAEGLTPYKQTMIQIAVFSAQERADTFKLQLVQKFTKVPFFIETRKDLFYVLAGPYDDKATATQVSESLKAEGVDNFVRSYKK